MQTAAQQTGMPDFSSRPRSQQYSHYSDEMAHHRGSHSLSRVASAPRNEAPSVHHPLDRLPWNVSKAPARRTQVQARDGRIFSIPASQAEAYGELETLLMP